MSKYAQKDTSKPTAIVWIDGQNLFHRVKTLFGRQIPDFDIRKLSQALCNQMGWQVKEINFYSGIPPEKESPYWSKFWKQKLANLSSQSGVPVNTFTPDLHYRNEWTRRNDGHWQLYRCPHEKGIDVRLALDMLSSTFERKSDCMILLSEDSDLQQAVERCHAIACGQFRKITIANAFPHDPSAQHQRRALKNTVPLRFDKSFYEQYIDQSVLTVKHASDREPKGKNINTEEIGRAQMAMQAAQNATKEQKAPLACH